MIKEIILTQIFASWSLPLSPTQFVPTNNLLSNAILYKSDAKMFVLIRLRSQIWTLWHGRVNFRFSDFPNVPNTFLDRANNFHLCANGYIYTVGYELGTLYERPYRPNTVRTRWWAKVHCNVTCFLVLFALYDFWRRTTNESRPGN